MNIHQLRCAVTVARMGSQTRAAEALYMSQPNLSKALKDLEQVCGFRIFTRTGTGMAPTRKGEAFLARARAILEQMDAMDAIYQGRNRATAYLSVVVPRAAYIDKALCRYLCGVGERGGLELSVRQTDTPEAIRAVLAREADIGVIRYAVEQQNKVLGALAEQGLSYILYWTFRYAAVMSHRHPLAREKALEAGRLRPYTEVAHPEGALVAEQPAGDEPRRQVRVNDHAAQLELLRAAPDAYMWASPIPADVLERYGLVQLPSEDATGDYQDALIYLKGYTMSRWEQSFYDLVRQEAEQLPHAP